MPNVLDYAPRQVRNGGGPRPVEEVATPPLSAAPAPANDIGPDEERHDFPLAPETPRDEIDGEADQDHAHGASAPKGGSEEAKFDGDMERLAELLSSIRRETATNGEPPPVPAGRAGPAPLLGRARESELYIDGLRVPRSLQPSYVPLPRPAPPTSYGKIIFRTGFACLAAAAIAFVVAGDRHSLKRWISGQPLTREVAERLLGEPAHGGTTAVAEPLVARAAEARPQPAIAPLSYSVASAGPAVETPPAAETQQTTQQTSQQAMLTTALPAPRAVPVLRVAPEPTDTLSRVAPSTPPVAARSAPPAAVPVPASPPQAPAAAHPHPAMDAQEIKLLLEQGKQFMAVGDVVTARIVLQRVADADVATGALALAETYDPAVLAKQGVRGVQGDADRARHWYERAHELGSDEATHRLALMAQP